MPPPSDLPCMSPSRSREGQFQRFSGRHLAVFYQVQLNVVRRRRWARAQHDAAMRRGQDAQYGGEKQEIVAARKSAHDSANASAIVL